MMRRFRRAFLTVGIVALVGTGLMAQSCTPTCPTGWGSGAKADNGPGTTSPVVASRVGQQECYDRFVIEVGGPIDGYDVRYVDNVYEDGSGELVPLAGGAKLQVVVRSPAYNVNFVPTYLPANRNQVHSVAGYDAFRQIAFLGSFEGTSSWGVGVRGRLPMRVLEIDGPGNHTRLAIDVAHRW